MTQDTHDGEERRENHVTKQSWDGVERRKNRHFIRTIAYALVAWEMLLTSTVLFLVHQNHNGAREGHSSHKALCFLKDDLRVRVRSGNEFLLTHPNGAFGISRSALLQSIVNQQKTLKSLDVLSC